MKNDVIVKDTFGVFFKSKWYDTNCFEKLEGGYIYMFMKKTEKLICSEMLH